MQKKRIKPATRAEMLARYDQEGPPEGWFYRVEEVSNLCWRVEGEDVYGRRVGCTATGPDPNELLAASVAEAELIRDQIGK